MDHIGVTINGSCAFPLLSILSGFYSMSILQSEDKCFIIIFQFIYWLLSYHYIYHLHSTTELYNLQRSSLHYSLWWSKWVPCHHNSYGRTLLNIHVLMLDITISYHNHFLTILSIHHHNHCSPKEKNQNTKKMCNYIDISLHIHDKYHANMIK